MQGEKFCQVKRVETKKTYVTRKEAIKITPKDIDELNDNIRKGCEETEIIRDKVLEIAKKCVMK